MNLQCLSLTVSLVRDVWWSGSIDISGRLILSDRRNKKMEMNSGHEDEVNIFAFQMHHEIFQLYYTHIYYCGGQNISNILLPVLALGRGQCNSSVGDR